MDQVNHYQIEVGGQMNEDEINAASPVIVKVLEISTDSTLLQVQADQPALIGLIRHLHVRGLFLCSITCQRKKV
jgi:hypothetical protein